MMSYKGPGPIEVNKEFEISKTSEYADGSMNNWSHHVQYILPQVHMYMYTSMCVHTHTMM